MSRLEELIKEYCPGGAEYLPLKDISSMKRGTSITKAQAVEGPYPVISGGREPAFYCDEYNREGDCITVAGSGAGAGFVQYWNEPIFVNDAFSVVGIDGVSTRYLFHCLSWLQEKIFGTKKGGGVPHVHISNIEGFMIPVPPLPVQEEIIRILDTFTEYTTSLENELDNRKQQLRHYSAELFSGAKKSNLQLVDALCLIEKGKTPIQKAEPGEYPLVVTTSERKCNRTFQFNSKSVCIPLVSSRGHGVASLNHVYYQEGKFALGNILCAVTPRDEGTLNAKYLYYYFEQTKDYTLVPLMKGGANVALHMDDIKRLKIPVPPLRVQEKIVDILTTFDDMNDHLKCELQLRKRQYEYYRDKILTFKDINEN